MLSSAELSLSLLVSRIGLFEGGLLGTAQVIHSLSGGPRCSQRCRGLVSVPNVNLIATVYLLARVKSISEFRGRERFTSFLNLVPSYRDDNRGVCGVRGAFENGGRLNPLIVRDT